MFKEKQSKCILGNTAYLNCRNVFITFRYILCFNNYYLQDLEELDPDFIMAKQVEQLEKEKKELQERLKNQEKKVKEKPMWMQAENNSTYN